MHFSRKKLIEEIENNEKYKQIFTLAKYAPDEFLEQIFIRLQAFKDMSKI